MKIIFFLIIFYFAFCTLLSIRFFSLGIEKNKAIVLSFLFPFLIINWHYNISKDFTDAKTKVQILLKPIYSLPEVIMEFAESVICVDATENVLKKMERTRSKKEMKVLYRELSKLEEFAFLKINGVNKKTRKVKLKSKNVSNKTIRDTKKQYIRQEKNDFKILA